MEKLSHELKIWPEYFEAVSQGKKTFEIRKDDRDFLEGDVLILREYDPQNDAYTGREVSVIITYMTNFAQVENYVVMAIKLIH